MDNSEIPDANGGDMMPPLSPCVDADLARVSVGVPTSKPYRQITKTTKVKQLTDKNKSPDNDINETSCDIGSDDAPILDNNPPTPLILTV